MVSIRALSVGLVTLATLTSGTLVIASATNAPAGGSGQDSRGASSGIRHNGEAAATAAPLPYYSVRSVGSMPPYFRQTYASGINAAGQVAGYGSDELDHSGAYLWTSGAADGIPDNREMKDLGDFSGGNYAANATAWALNDQGHVVGHATLEEFGWTRAHAFVWKDGRMTDLGTLTGEPFLDSTARGVNEAGMITGSSDTQGTELDRHRHAFIYDPGTKQMRDLGLDHSYGESINDQGQVVGYYFPEPSVARAFYWDAQSGVSDLHGRLACGGSQSRATAINNSRQVVGWCQDKAGVDRAFFLDLATGTVIRLDGPKPTRASALNEHGLVVGSLKHTDRLDHAMVWHPATGAMADLNDRIPYTERLVLVAAWAINDAGQIAGDGNHTTDAANDRGFVLTPGAEPQLSSLAASPSQPLRGTPIKVQWTAPSGHSGRDWVALCAVGDPDGFCYPKQFTGTQSASGELVFTAPNTAGSYNFRMFIDDTYQKIATSNVVEIR